MTAPLNNAPPDECCGSHCRHCNYWRTSEHEAACSAGFAASLAGPLPEDDEPFEIGICDWCGATPAELDENRLCIRCSERLNAARTEAA
jgi:hypothetical protein